MYWVNLSCEMDDVAKSFSQMLLSQHRSEFPNVVSFQRFVELMHQDLIPWCGFLLSRRGENSGIGFVDSTAIGVCPGARQDRRGPRYSV